MDSFFSQEELMKIGFNRCGKNVLISRKASIYNAEKISIGDNVRIDDFCIISGNVTLGNYIHIAAYCCLFGGTSGIEMQDFSGLSSRCAIYADSDDYSGYAMTNPMVPDKYRNVLGGHVVLEKHSIIGSGSTILPNLTIGEGTSVGSMSLVSKTLDAWTIYVGIPCKKIKARNKRILTLEAMLINDTN